MWRYRPVWGPPGVYLTLWGVQCAVSRLKLNLSSASRHLLALWGTQLNHLYNIDPTLAPTLCWWSLLCSGPTTGKTNYIFYKFTWCTSILLGRGWSCDDLMCYREIFGFLFQNKTLSQCMARCLNADVMTENRNGVCWFYRISCISIEERQIAVKTAEIKVGGRECWLADDGQEWKRKYFTLKNICSLTDRLWADPCWWEPADKADKASLTTD